MKKLGKLIVLEGIDGSGTTTLASLLYKRISEANIDVYKTAQPSNSLFGQNIRSILNKTLFDQDKQPGFETMSLLFAADRQYQQESEIKPKLIKGEHVICDRYLHSSVIYQSTMQGGESAIYWIKEINKFIQPADLVFYLKIDSETALSRRKTRGGKEEIFENNVFQNKLIEKYNKIEHLFPNDNIIILDATKSLEFLENQAFNKICELLEK